MENADDIGLVPLYEWVRDIVGFGIENFLHNSLLPDQWCPVIFASASVSIIVH